MVEYEADEWVWLPDEKEFMLPVQCISAFKAGEEGRLRTQDGKALQLSASQTTGLTKLRDQKVLDDSIDDLIDLDDLSEQAIIHKLRARFAKDCVYTAISSILVAVNPLRKLPIYSKEMMREYRSSQQAGLAPHAFDVANKAYRGAVEQQLPQAVIISGESGAGKTETTKFLLAFVAFAASGGRGGGGLEEQILQANPCIEAFGNASTSRNHNSSRFGKLITISLDVASGSILKGTITNYLLEKSRVTQVHSASGGGECGMDDQSERNYHIFYQLTAFTNTISTVAGAAELEAVHSWLGVDNLWLRMPETDRGVLPSGHTFRSTGLAASSGCQSSKPVVKELESFNETVMAMKTLRIPVEQQQQIFGTIAAVLHLSNLSFGDGEPDADTDATVAPSCAQWLEMASVCLGVEQDAIRTALIKRTVGAGNRSVVQVHPTCSAAPFSSLLLLACCSSLSRCPIRVLRLPPAVTPW
jgi:myosin heavy subunit